MPIKAPALRGLARQSEQNRLVGLGVQTTAGGTALVRQHDDWTLFKITDIGTNSEQYTYDVGGYSGVEVALDYSWLAPPISSEDKPGFAEVAGGRKADKLLSPIRSVLSGVVFEINQIVQARPSRARPGDWEAIPFYERRRNRVTIPVAYCDGDELKYYAICIEGDIEVVSCDESSSSSNNV